MLQRARSAQFDTVYSVTALDLTRQFEVTPSTVA
jgi:hypothetical protein